MVEYLGTSHVQQAVTQSSAEGWSLGTRPGYLDTPGTGAPHWAMS